MSPQAQLAILLWVPIIFYIFSTLPPRTAVIVTFIGGLLFLPQGAGFRLPLIPDFNRTGSTTYGILLAILVFDSQSLSRLKLGWLDIPMMLWCISPIFASLANGLGAYDGVNQSIVQTVTWGLPYLLGRIYLSNLAGLKELALRIIQGGIIYIPLVLFEGRFSPQLHNIVYGYHAHESGISQSIRLGGFRPIVFMQHGLMLGMWMMLVALLALWLWKSGTLKDIWGMSLDWLVWVLIFSFIWCRSTSAYGYFIYALIILFSAKWLRTNLPLILLICAISYYLYIAVTGNFDGDGIVQIAADLTNADRAQSLEFRFDNEELLVQRAQQKMLFGWGGWGRSRVYQEDWAGDIVDISVTDSLWVIVFGTTGVFGLINLTTSLLLPSLIFCWSTYPPKTWFKPQVAPAAALAVGVVIFMLDCLLNYMFNPIFPMISGGLVGLILQPNRINTELNPQSSPLNSQVLQAKLLAWRRLKRQRLLTKK